MRGPMPPTYAAAWLSPRWAPGASPSRSPGGLISGRSERNAKPPARHPRVLHCGGAGRTEIAARDSHRRPEAPVDGGAIRSEGRLAGWSGSPTTHGNAQRGAAVEGAGGDERPARGSLRCVRSFRCAARRESGFSTGCRAAGASSAACYLADDATGWSGGVSIPISMAHLPR
jgi:hypothetical protein